MTVPFCVEDHQGGARECLPAPKVEYQRPWRPARGRDWGRELRTMRLELDDVRSNGLVMGCLAEENQEHWNSARLVAVLRRRMP